MYLWFAQIYGLNCATTVNAKHLLPYMQQEVSLVKHKDDEISSLPHEYLVEEYRKLKELKKKANHFASEARQTAQKVNHNQLHKNYNPMNVHINSSLIFRVDDCTVYMFAVNIICTVLSCTCQMTTITVATSFQHLNVVILSLLAMVSNIFGFPQVLFDYIVNM